MFKLSTLTGMVPNEPLAAAVRSCRLAVSDLGFFELSAEYAEVFGKFHLARETSIGDASGLFTLLMKRKGNRWLVLHDHTSAAD